MSSINPRLASSRCQISRDEYDFETLRNYIIYYLQLLEFYLKIDLVRCNKC